MPIIKYVDLFCGTGAFSLAMNKIPQAECVFANDICPNSHIIYKTNFPSHNFVKSKLEDIKVEDIPAHDILFAGFPCQSFSTAGLLVSNISQRRSGLEVDPRETCTPREGPGPREMTELGIDMVSRSTHDLNALSSIIKTVSGILIVLKRIHPLNALELILSNSDPGVNVTVRSPIQYLNVLSSRVSTLRGMLIVKRPGHSSNAPRPMKSTSA